ncbi:MAG: hypothetical protein ACE5EM_04890 [Sphingomonadales bacterium]
MAAGNFRPLLICLAALALAGCATAGNWRATGSQGADGGTLQCLGDLRAITDAVQAAGVSDGSARPVRQFPYLRVDRLLASFRDRPNLNQFLGPWMTRMRTLDRTARHHELANLPPADRARLGEALGAQDPASVITRCGDYLAARDLADDQARSHLIKAAKSPDHYLDWRRFFGLYPLTAIPVSIGYRRWQRRNLGDFARPLTAIAPSGELTTYVPAASAGPLSPSETAEIIARSRNNPLGIPEPSGTQLARLIEAFAPVWQVDTLSGDDRIGTPEWGPDQQSRVNTDLPVSYTRLSHVWWDNELLLQINYAIWFPARPKRGGFDLLGGKFDGLVWRVTLGPDGKVILYDSMHQCGCYHLFFPSNELEIRPGADGSNGEDGVVAPQAAPAVGPGQRVLIRVSGTSHYIAKLGIWESNPDSGAPVQYRMMPDDGLRSLPFGPGQRRSLFRPDGLVAGSARAERFLLWPMGIKSAGAMRQWGTHATAFVGRRHFDDPRLMEQSFFHRGHAKIP